MKPASEIIKNLKTTGSKITPVRSALIEIFLKNTAPLSISDIITALKKKDLKPNKTTIYREVDFLKNLDILDEIGFGDGKKRYEILTNHHHHIVCINCKKIKDISMEKDLDLFKNKISKETGFKLAGHSLEFFGLCNNCQDENSI